MAKEIKDSQTDPQPDARAEAEPIPVVGVTVLRDITIGDTHYPSGASIGVPAEYAQTLIDTGNAVLAKIEPIDPGEPIPEMEGQVRGHSRR
jgi:hypothetical protein